VSLSTFYMDEFSCLFEVDIQCRVLICVQCQFAVVPSQVDKHLRAHHSRVSVVQRQRLIAKVDDLSRLATVHSDVVYPLSADPPVASLPTYFDGLRCSSVDESGTACAYICRTPPGIQEHCIQQHQWTNRQKRGGDVRSKTLHQRSCVTTIKS
jgi:hypothetical protein